MSDDLTVDCTQCKDLEFARNLVRSMKEGYGRHNSNRDFSGRRRLASFDVGVGERVISMVDGHIVKARLEDCLLGDSVYDGDVQHKMPGKARFIHIHVNPSGERRVFEKVRVEIQTPFRSREPETHYFWKRIE